MWQAECPLRPAERAKAPGPEGKLKQNSIKITELSKVAARNKSLDAEGLHEGKLLSQSPGTGHSGQASRGGSAVSKAGLHPGSRKVSAMHQPCRLA